VSTNVADMWVMSNMIKATFTGSPGGVPPFYAPSTDVCDA
jgi:hypothetical protein